MSRLQYKIIRKMYELYKSLPMHAQLLQQGLNDSDQKAQSFFPGTSHRKREAGELMVVRWRGSDVSACSPSRTLSHQNTTSGLSHK